MARVWGSLGLLIGLFVVRLVGHHDIMLCWVYGWAFGALGTGFLDCFANPQPNVPR